VQAQGCASSVSQAVAPHDYIPGTNSLVHNPRLTNSAINPAAIQHRTGTSAFHQELTDVPNRQKLRIHGTSL